MKLTRRARRTPRGERPAPERVSWPGLIIVLLVMFVVGFVYAYPRLKRPPLVERDFVGRVVDKHLTLRESEIGTSPRLRLLVRTSDGSQLNVAVTEEAYERARVGMWATRRGGEVSLSWDEPEPRAAREGTEQVEGR